MGRCEFIRIYKLPFPLVPKLQLGNAAWEAPASRLPTRQAGACRAGFPTWRLGTSVTSAIDVRPRLRLTSMGIISRAGTLPCAYWEILSKSIGKSISSIIPA